MLLEVEKDDAEDVSQREGVNNAEAFVHAKAESSLATDLRNCKPNPKTHAIAKLQRIEISQVQECKCAQLVQLLKNTYVPYCA